MEVEAAPHGVAAEEPGVPGEQLGPATLAAEVRRFVVAQGLVGVDVTGMGEQELQSLTLEAAVCRGWPRAEAARVVAKVNGWRRRQQQRQQEQESDADNAGGKREALRRLAIAMLQRDDQLRLSPATQDKYARAGDDGSRKYAITVAIQKQVAGTHPGCRCPAARLRHWSSSPLLGRWPESSGLEAARHP